MKTYKELEQENAKLDRALRAISIHLNPRLLSPAFIALARETAEKAIEGRPKP